MAEEGGGQSGVSSGCFLRMQKAWRGLSGSVPSFFLFLSGSQHNGSGTYSELPRGLLCNDAAGWAARASSPPPHPSSCLPGWMQEVAEWAGWVGNPLVRWSAGFAGAVGYKRSSVIGRAEGEGDTEAEMEGYIGIIRCGGAVGTGSTYSSGHHQHNGCFS